MFTCREWGGPMEAERDKPSTPSQREWLSRNTPECFVSPYHPEETKTCHTQSPKAATIALVNTGASCCRAHRKSPQARLGTSCAQITHASKQRSGSPGALCIRFSQTRIPKYNQTFPLTLNISYFIMRCTHCLHHPQSFWQEFR